VKRKRVSQPIGLSFSTKQEERVQRGDAFSPHSPDEAAILSALATIES
jgi:hypothetical protein